MGWPASQAIKRRSYASGSRVYMPYLVLCPASDGDPDVFEIQLILDTADIRRKGEHVLAE
jgi:hypothetical protein